MSKLPKPRKKNPDWKIRDNELWTRMTKIMRSLHDWKCEYCCYLYKTGKRKEAPRDYSCARRGLQTHHYFGKSRWSTKFYPANLVVLCYGHHRIFHGDNPRITKKQRDGWMKNEKLDEERWIRLHERAWQKNVKRDAILDEAEAWITDMEELIEKSPAVARAKLEELAA